jgi:hypothetical protein
VGDDLLLGKRLKERRAVHPVEVDEVDEGPPVDGVQGQGQQAGAVAAP